MTVRLWDSDVGSIPVGAPRDTLQYVYGKRSSGILWFRGEVDASLELHLDDGNVVNCIGADDEVLLAHLLVSSSLVTEQELEDLAARPEPRWLAEALVDEGILSQQVLQSILAELVKDQIFHACATAWKVIEFEEDVPTFEPDLLPNLNLGEILENVQGWSSRVLPLQALVTDGHDAVIQRRADVEASSAEQRIVLDQIRGVTRYSEIISRAPLARYRTMDVLVSLVTCGAITIAPAVE